MADTVGNSCFCMLFFVFPQKISKVQPKFSNMFGGRSMFDVIIVGCGVIGAAVAYELSKYQISVAVLEKENDVACGTTRANSGIIHAGYDPKPGTLMAKLNVEGARLTEALCKHLDVPYKRTGSMVLAFTEEELPVLQKLYDRGIANGVPKLQLLSGDEARQMESYLSHEVVGALYAPTAGIINPWEYTLAMAETAIKNGVQIFLNHEVHGIEKIEGGYRVQTSGGLYEGCYVVNAAGVHSDEIHNKVDSNQLRIQPNKGEYYMLDKGEGAKANFVLFQCPTKDGKGVLVSPAIHGNLIVGPDAKAIEDKEDVSTTAQGLAFVKKMALKSIPSINFRESVRNFAGLRAVLEGVDDFLIEESKEAANFFDLAGIKSPGLTCAPAIAKMLAGLLNGKGLVLREKEALVLTRKKVRFHELSMDEKNTLIAKNPAYGRVICRCETITEGEIIDAIHSPLTPVSIDGVKRRCNAGLGRCQGGFCGPRVLEILSRELKLPPESILQDKAGSYMITGETKSGGNRHV